MRRSGARFISVAISVSMWAAGLPAGEVDREKLRSLADVPKITANGFTEKELEKLQESLRRREIEKIRKSLTGGDADAELWQRLGHLHRLLYEDGKEKEAAAKAAALFRKRIEKRPDEPTLLAELGTALDRSGQEGEAEAVLRKAVEKGPGEWRCWLALADHRRTEPLNALLEGTGGLAGAIERLRARKDLPDRLARAKKLLDEVAGCYDRAIACASPDAPEPYEGRAVFRGGGTALVRWLIWAIEGGSTDLRVLLAEEESKDDAALDFEEAARRRPGDFSATSLAVIHALRAFIARSSAKDARDCDLNRAPEERKEAFREAMARLEKQSAGPDEATSAAALEVLAMLRFFFRDFAGAEGSARAALALDPSRESLSEFLAGFLVRAGKREEAIAFLEEQLKAKDTARTRCILARLLATEGKREEAEKELEAALRIDPDDFGANLGLAALLLRRTPVGGDLRRVSDLIDKATVAYRKAEDPDPWRDLEVVTAIFDGLTGHAADGREKLAPVIDHDPDDGRLKEIWAALGGEPIIAISTEEARKYYEEHPGEFASEGEVTFRMISVDEGESAKGILAGLDGDLEAKPFVEVARKFYAEKSGGDDSFFLRTVSVETLRDWKKPLAAEILGMKPGEVKRRIQLEDKSGWRYVELVSRTAGGKKSFDAVRPQVEEELRAGRREKDRGKTSASPPGREKAER